MSYQNELPTGTVGAISELAIAVDLMKKGYSVFRSLSPSCKFDFFAYKDGIALKVEARTGYKHAVSGNVHYPRRKDDQADVYAAYVSRTNTVYYFGEDYTSPRGM